ncbi:DUF58 domain-containing protein [methane-oxidizing endosymbiont of Gigantopelta aegis]|uniref:DUF58 domain-containing protein n=1 Tax=methane-oxidizing endosymbiont of Gigantopelta aegis TaxID=2794938 RepID=UPI0018DE1D75|nr:DUF58 domain-containing protein [methane-oxidizing endosymbiont of Gigantopelta aegis]
MLRNDVFYYRKPAQYAIFPGAHPGQMAGNGFLFKQHRALISQPDPRHIDLRASLLNPFSEYRVKSFQQQSRLDVFLLADFSASMSYHGHNSKPQAVIDCLLSVAQSAHATGDRFGFIGCGQTLKHQWLIAPASLQLGRVMDIAQQISPAVFAGKAESLLEAPDYLPDSAALVFVLSDFHMPVRMIQNTMQRLNKHTVIPLVLWDNKAYRDLPRWGVMRLADLERGKARTLWMRPGLNKKIQAAYAQRKRLLQHCFRSFGCEPLFLEQGYQADAVSQYFLQQ